MRPRSASSPAVRDVLGYLKEEADEPFDFLASLHGSTTTRPSRAWRCTTSS